MSNQPQHHAEAGLREKTTVLRVCYLPYLSQYAGRYLGALKEADGALARNDPELIAICLVEEVGVRTFLLVRKVEDGMIYINISIL